MLFKESDSLEEIWQVVKHELHRGALDAKHPFHWVNLGTHGADFPEIRKVVLRKITDTFHFLIFTDYRSQKVKELKTNPKASLHFYHPKKQVQVRVRANTKIHFKNDFSEEFWLSISESRRKEYLGKYSPGTFIPDHEEGWERLDDVNHFFTVLEFIPLEIEVLQLSRNGHLRILFSSKKEWEGNWLVP
ncbi:pyridoxamine 5'-phosphate oxidase family protein [Algoriphagus limi]|uniref:Pyridoxamine 5'-phosphate oxidase family protein n=1 Tax=Algoriphagus limi TaxID=2975273 RepID=A0ABT2G5J8_9BACT|nr:pyridoxamine 5'-phosphate oxidase family protein [Algoriphagus limi]MCS5490550.1 pyridoxamine 5'-phosphate oxidase family protein [Algoriphagus limi]